MDNFANEELIQPYKEGKSFKEIGEMFGITEKSAYGRLVRLGVHKTKRITPRRSKEDLAMLAEVANELWNKGLNTLQIVEELRVNSSWLSKVLDTSNGKPWKEKRNQEMREYKAQGKTMRDVAEHFGMNEKYVNVICKGIAPQKPKSRKGIESPLKGVVDEDNAIRMIAERLPNIEYAGGFTGCDGRVNLRCKRCGAVFNRSMISVRKKQTSCPECRKKKSEVLARQKAEEKAARELEREKRRIQAEARRVERKLNQERKKKESLHPCAVCGKITARPKYCSDDCLHHAMNARHEYKRRIKIKSAYVDKGISVKSLFKRDKGVCHICGKECSLEDYIIRDGTFIAGDWYPSVDHVVALSKGGLHSWANVKLAHRLCNTIKGADGLQ